jgi:hypothetical protein
MRDDENLPTSMTADETAALLGCIRNPRILRHLIERPIGELVHDLLPAEIECDPSREIYVENRVIGFIVALQPMLAATVTEFFELSDEERAELWKRLDEYNRNIPSDEEWADDGSLSWVGPFDKAWTALDDLLRTMSASEWKRLALDVVAKPEAMICNVRAMEAFRVVLDLKRFGEIRLTGAEIDIVNIVGNLPALNNVLAVLRDIRRVFR